MCTTTCVDDLSIEAADRLLRRVPPFWVVPDPKVGYRVASAAFDNDPEDGHMSVNIAATMATAGIPEDVMLEGHDAFSLVAFSAGVARSVNQLNMRNPLPENVAHGLVCGVKSKATRRRMSEAAQWVIFRPPSNV